MTSPARGAQAIRGFANRLRHGADRLTRRDDHDGQDQQRQRQTRGGNALPQPELIHEQAQRQQAVDDGRHARQVGDVDFNDRREPVLRRVLFEIDRRGDADRHRAERRHQHDQRRADPGAENAGALGAA